MTDPLATLLTAVGSDARVLGVVVGGSRGKGLVTLASDWDVYLVLVDGVTKETLLRKLDLSHPRLDLCAAFTLDEFAKYALPQTTEEWNAYNFAHLTPTLDRTGGLLQELCNAKEFIPEELARERGAAVLDAYINSYYRSMKNHRDGNIPASCLDAAESVPRLVAFAFTAELRVPPYNKFLAWELATHPLAMAWWPSATPIDGLLGIVRSASLQAQAAQFRLVERWGRTLGYGDTIDGWGSWSLTALRSGPTHG